MKSTICLSELLVMTITVVRQNSILYSRLIKPAKTTCDVDSDVLLVKCEWFHVNVG